MQHARQTLIHTQIILFAFAVPLFATAPVHAAAYKALHSFCKKYFCGDGSMPRESLARDQAGNLYGAADGGAHGEGVVFELMAPAGEVVKWRYKVLYHFCAQQNCNDGRALTNSTLVLDTAGNVYGTTYGGGAGNDTGTVFELSRPTHGKQWTLRTLYSFCVKLSSCHDGANPMGGLTHAGRESGLPYDGVSPLYGTTTRGGGKFGGVAYSLTPRGNGKWSEDVVYKFCREVDSCADGAGPIERLTMDAAGNVYGITDKGGANGRGVAFKLSGIGTQVTESVLYDVCSDCTPVSGLTADPAGNVFGSSWTGGSRSRGFVFKIAADGTFTDLYDFCTQGGCSDGDGPFSEGGLVVDDAGNVYGTTHFGGDHDDGVLFKLGSSGLQVLYSFCAKKACADGGIPFGGVIMDLSGRLYGTTLRYGKYGDGGTVFELSP